MAGATAAAAGAALPAVGQASSEQVPGWQAPPPEWVPGRTDEERTRLRMERIRQRREMRGRPVHIAAMTIGVEADDWRAFEDGSREPSLREGLAMGVLLDTECRWLGGMA